MPSTSSSGRAAEPGHPRRAMRRGGEERAGVGVPHRGQHAAGRPGFHDAALVHHRHAVGEAGDHREVVGDQHQPHAVLVDEPPQQREDRRLGGDVEGGRRLVGDQQLRAQRDRHGDADALALAAGELVRVAGRAESGPVAGRRARASPRRSRAPRPGRRRRGCGRSRPPGRRWSSAGSARSSAPGRSCRRRGRGPRRARARRGKAGRCRRARSGRWRGRPRGGGRIDRERGHRLARAALADEAEDLAAARRSRETRSSTGWPWMASVRSSIARRGAAAVTPAPGAGAGRAGRAGRRPSG